MQIITLTPESADILTCPVNINVQLFEIPYEGIKMLLMHLRVFEWNKTKITGTAYRMGSVTNFFNISEYISHKSIKVAYVKIVLAVNIHTNKSAMPDKIFCGS